MKIGFLINDLGVGGAEKVFIDQANELSRLGHEVSFLVLNKKMVDPSFRRRLSDAVKYYDFSYLGFVDFFQFIKVRSTLRSNKVEILYSTLDRANVVSRMQKILLPSLRVFIRESGMADRKKTWVKVLDNLLNFLCQKIIAVSPGVAASLAKYQPFHVRKIVVIENGVIDTGECFRSDPQDVFDLLHVGSMNNENKNQRFLIRVLGVLKQVEPTKSVRLNLVGSGKLQGELEQYAKSLGLESAVKFWGNCDGPVLEKIYCQCHLFVFASRSEGSPNVVLEAMVSGLPVIAVDIASVSPLIEEGRNGFVLPGWDEKKFADKVGYFLTNPQGLKIFGEAARQAALRRHPLEQVVKKVENLFCNG